MFFFFVFLALLAAACSEAPHISAPAPQFDLDPVFREYYNFLGGGSILGEPIAPSTTEGTATVQYLTNAKLIFDPTAPPEQRFRLAPLGVELGLFEPPADSLGKPSYPAGHAIDPTFLPLYEKLGAANVGPPLTECRYNPSKRRYEQFFENLGFYRMEDSNEVHLLAYGVWACGEACRADQVLRDATIDTQREIDPTFVPFIKQFGVEFSGFALTPAYVGRDGKWEQVLEDFVLVADAPNDFDSVSLRPLSTELKIAPEAPVENNFAPDMYFFTVDGEKGYSIPSYFWNYIMAHGGLGVSGFPITHLQPLNGLAYHQCFVNLCLVYNPRATEAARVHPETLGYAYKALYYTGQGKPTENQPLPQKLTVTMRIWERYPAVTSTQRQEIGVIILENNFPKAGITPELLYTLLDGSRVSLAMPPTDQQGQSSLLLEPIVAPNGVLILYQVCIPRANNETFCVGDSYVIWNNP